MPRALRAPGSVSPGVYGAGTLRLYAPYTPGGALQWRGEGGPTTYRRPARNVMTDCKTIARIAATPARWTTDATDLTNRFETSRVSYARHVTQRAFASRVISGSGVGMECAHFSRASIAQPAMTPRCITISPL